VNKEYLLAILFFFTLFLSPQDLKGKPTAEGSWSNIIPSYDPPGTYDMSNGTFVSEQIGWFAQDYPAQVWKTIDGGLNWFIQKDSIGTWFHDIDFLDRYYGWVAGETTGSREHFLLYTSDGGTSWKEISNFPFSCISFLDSLTGIAGGNNTLYRTIDGGIIWIPVSIQPSTHLGIMDIFFVDQQRGWAVGSSGDVTDAGILLGTQNSGEAWNVVIHPGPVLQGVHFPSPSYGCAVGFNVFGGGVITTSADSGRSWNYHNPQSYWLRDVAFINVGTGWAVGDNGMIWQTEDSGSKWDLVESNTQADLGSIVIIEPDSVGYILGEDNILFKYDYKNLWIGSDAEIVPLAFSLHQNHPNPFNPITTIRYDLSHASEVSLIVYDLLGREVTRLVSGYVEPGYHEVQWHGQEFPSGIYIARLVTTGYSKSIKMVLLK
jgi:photosystem II stability/assembly factor-like uncharacterized protein